MGSRRALFTAVLLLAPTIAGGQAWTPPAGQGTVWLSGQMLHADAHLQGNGITANDIDLRAQTATLGFDYGLTDRLALGMSLPYFGGRLDAGRPHVGSTVDDGRMHRSLSDLRVELRYKAIDSSVLFTPTLSAVIPTRDYETLGHAATGRGVNEYSAGFQVGHNAISISPSLFVSAGYEYSYVQRIDDHVTVDRSNADLEFDYLVTARLGLSASGTWQKTHGGLDLPLSPDQRAEHAHHHDQLARANFLHGSAGISYGLTPTLDVFGSWSTVIEGVNTHAFRAWSGGIAWRFDGSRLRRNPRQKIASLPQMHGR